MMPLKDGTQYTGTGLSPNTCLTQDRDAHLGLWRLLPPLATDLHISVRDVSSLKQPETDLKTGTKQVQWYQNAHIKWWFSQHCQAPTPKSSPPGLQILMCTQGSCFRGSTVFAVQIHGMRHSRGHRLAVQLCGISIRMTYLIVV